MRHLRHIPAHCIIDDSLSSGIGQMIVAANDVRHTHIVIVDNDRMHISRRTIGTQNDEIVQILVRETHIALHCILHEGLAFLRCLDPNDWLHTCRRFGRVTITPATVITRGRPSARAFSRISSSSSGVA